MSSFILRRKTKRKSLTHYFDDSDEGNFSPLFQRRKTKKKTPAKAKTSKSTFPVPEMIDSGAEDSHFKKIQSENVDEFFKSKNLVSDSDDEEFINQIKGNINKNANLRKDVPVKDKNFYSISDSDDEIKVVPDPVTTAPVVLPSVPNENLFEYSKPSTSKTDDSVVDVSTDLISVADIMADIDKIVPKRTPLQKAQLGKDESWDKMFEETEEILENVAKLVGIEVKTKPGPESPDKISPKCPVCLESLSDRETLATVCGHLFCKECISAVLQSSTKKCPTCRKAINKKKVHPVYF